MKIAPKKFVSRGKEFFASKKHVIKVGKLGHVDLLETAVKAPVIGYAYHNYGANGVILHYAIDQGITCTKSLTKDFCYYIKKAKNARKNNFSGAVLDDMNFLNQTPKKEIKPLIHKELKNNLNIFNVGLKTVFKNFRSRNNPV